MMRSITHEKDLKGIRVLVRLSVNIPIDGGMVIDDLRLRRMLPTIAYLRQEGARIIGCGHISQEGEQSLRPVFEHFRSMTPMIFVDDFSSGSGARDIAGLEAGDMALLENLRGYPGEKSNDPVFASSLASLADVYVNDSFADSHRPHASIIGVPKLIQGFAGIDFEREVEYLSTAQNPPHPYLMIIGGAKFTTKVPVIEKFLDIADNVFVTGALMNDFFAAKGYNVGASSLSPAEERTDMSKLLLHKRLMLPIDVAVKSSEGVFARKPNEIKANERILDVGPQTIKLLAPLIDRARFILWNGPFGKFEEGFRERTEDVARLIAASRATTVVGGGDTLASIVRLRLEDKFSFTSTAGGALIHYLSEGTLPGIEALKASAAKR